MAHAGDLQQLQLVEERSHRAVRVAEEDTAPHARECPSEPFEHRLALNVVAELFEREITISIALDSQTLSVSFHNQIDAHGADFPSRNDVVAGLNQSLHDIAFEGRLNIRFLVVEGASKEFGRLGVLNETPSQVAWLKVRLRVQRVNDPHLISRAAGGHVIPLLEHLLVTKIERSARRGVHNGQENHITFISLKLGRGSTQQTMPFIRVGGKVCSQEAVDLQSLLLAHKGNHANAGWRSELVGLVLCLFKCGCDERSNNSGFLAVDFSVPGRADDGVGKDVRPQSNVARIA